MLMYYTKSSLGLTMMIVAFWSILVPMACGASYGIVPFITKRGLGSASGMVGAGGNTGAAITQAIFFTSASMTTAEGFKWMGVMIISVTSVVVTLVHFPIAGWGSMFLKGNPNGTEESYYLKDFSEEEIKQGEHLQVLKFANESRSQRGFKAAADLEKEGSGLIV